MRPNLTFISITMLIALVAHAPTAVASGYTNTLFRRAMSKDNPAVTASGRLRRSDGERDLVHVSTTPLYVLITIRQPRANSQRQVCVLSSNLEDAIAQEHHLDIIQDARKIFDIAIASPSRVFVFKSPSARKVIAPAYTQEQLEKVRTFVHGYSRKTLRKEAKVDLSKPPNQQSSLTKIYRRNQGKRLWISDSYKAAVAHVLLENGILVGELHDAGALYVDEQESL